MSRLGPIALYLAIIGLVWYLGFLPHVVAAGLAVVCIVSGLVPERWSSLTAGVLVLIGAGMIYIRYTGSGDRRLALLAAVIGIILVIVGVVRVRAGRA